MYNFACFLQPDLDATPLPPSRIARLVTEGKRGLPSGQGVYDWSRRDGAALLDARREELMRWLKRDRGL
jgi:3-hydroxybutyryl-CoA dehydrogenase